MPKVKLKIKSKNLKLDKIFPVHVKKIWLEIGFGSGENIKWQLDNNKDIGFIACEPYINGIADLLILLDKDHLSRIKIYNGDARELFNIFNPNTFEKVFILFPDPWPKKKHYKRRIIQKSTLNLINAIMTFGGELRISSDDYSYVCWIMHHIINNKNYKWMAKCQKDYLDKPDSWPITKYQEKADIKGHTSYYFKLLKV